MRKLFRSPSSFFACCEVLTPQNWCNLRMYLLPSKHKAHSMDTDRLCQYHWVDYSSPFRTPASNSRPGTIALAHSRIPSSTSPTVTPVAFSRIIGVEVKPKTNSNLRTVATLHDEFRWRPTDPPFSRLMYSFGSSTLKNNEVDALSQQGANLVPLGRNCFACTWFSGLCLAAFSAHCPGGRGFLVCTNW